MKISRFNILWHIVFVSSFLTFTTWPLGDSLFGGSLGDFLSVLGLGILSYGLLYLLLRKNYEIGKFWGAAVNYLGAVISLAIAMLLYFFAGLSCAFGGCSGEVFIVVIFLVTSSVLTFLLGYMRLVSRWKVKPLIPTIIFLVVVAIAIFSFLEESGVFR